MSDLTQYISEEALPFLKATWLGNCCTVGVGTLVFYDFVTTLPEEAQLIWGRPSNSVTVLYHLNRWAVLTWAATVLAVTFIPLTTLSSCVAVNTFLSSVTLVLFLLCTAFSTIRTYAISMGSLWLASIVCMLCTVPVGVNIWLYFADEWYQVKTSPYVGSYCDNGVKSSETANTSLTIASRLCAIVADLILLSVTCFQTFALKRRSHGGVRTPLIDTLLRDGTAYFLLLLVLNVVLAVENVASSGVSTVSALFLTPLLSIITSHFLLNLRQVAYGSEDGMSDSERQSTTYCRGLKFTHFLGNMGEDLDDGLDSEDPDMAWIDRADDAGDAAPGHLTVQIGAKSIDIQAAV